MLLPTENATYVWAVGGDGVNASARVNVTRAQLEQRVHAIRLTLDFAVMGTRITPFDTVDSNTLYQMLLAPVAASLQGKKHLIVAAGGVLGQIPFGVLLTQPFDKVNADAPWLIKQFAVTHVPSLSAWLAVKRFAKTNSAAEAFIAWGDPKFGIAAKVASDDATGTRHVALKRSVRSASIEIEPTRSALRYSDIPALPETRDELLSIASALHADPKHDLHLGERATKLSVLQSSTDGELQRKKVVAFATHGLMAGDLPHLSQPALALAGTGNEAKEPLSALLTLDEVLNLKLNADWVILSACNTAAADGRADEALSGLARGFFYAGSRSLLVTHWSVESESAKQITTKTMDYYTAHPTERKAESLRQAMLTVMGNPQYAHPAYWAPYALTGEGGR
jgi:CHAT domain-containing protein